MNRKISEVIRSQANYMFQQKRQEVIHNTIRKISERTGKRFEDVLSIYMNNNLNNI